MDEFETDVQVHDASDFTDEVIARLLQAEYDLEYEERQKELQLERQKKAEEKNIEESKEKVQNEIAQPTGPLSINTMPFQEKKKGLTKSISQTFVELIRPKKEESPLEDLQLTMSAPSSPVKSGGPTDISFGGFMKMINENNSVLLARYIRIFIKEFLKRNLSPEEQTRVFHQFLDFIRDKYYEDVRWKDCSEEYFDSLQDHTEKLIISKIYSKAFSPVRSDDSLQDEQLHRKIFIHQWVDYRNLDIEYNLLPDRMEPIYDEFLRMSEYRSPKDKLICIVNGCRRIFDLMHELNESKSSVGADEFLPILVYVIIKCNPPKLLSNIRFIGRFRHPRYLFGESSYFLTHLSGAVMFLEKLDSSSLSHMSEEVYKEFIMYHEQSYLELLKKRQQKSTLSRSASLDKVSAKTATLSKMFEKPLKALNRFFTDDDDDDSTQPTSGASGTSSDLDFDLQMAIAVSMSLAESKKQSRSISRSPDGRRSISPHKNDAHRISRPANRPSLLDTPNDDISFETLASTPK